MNNIYTYISSNGVQKAIGHSLVALFRHHPKAILLFVCLAFFAFGAPAHAQVTLSGTIYSDAGSTVDGTSRTINVAVGTTTPGIFASTSMTTSGAYTVTIPAGSGIAIGTPILVWIDGGTVLGSVVTKASSSIDGANITGLDIYRNRLITRHEATSATSTTINDLAFYTTTQDADVTHATTSNGEIVVRSGVELYVWGGDTFAPGGAITVAGNAGAGATEGSMTMGASSVYIATSTLRLAGSLTVPSTATFNAGSSTIFFVASTTGKTISAPVTSIGNVTFVGNGGGWSFTSSATTSSLTILVGSVTAPSTALAVQGTYQNYGTFNNNGGKMTIIGAPTIPAGNFPSYTAGIDVSGSAAGTGNLQINQMAVSSNGRTLYAGSAGSATPCNPTVGNAIGCELLVIDIANTAAPAFLTGRDANGNTVGAGNVAINNLLVSGNYLYVAKAGNVTGCTQASTTASGCELMVFDISSTTNPVFVAGRDMDGTAAGTQNIAALSLAAKGTSLYLAKAASGATACNTAALNCELMVFDISSTTNPTYQTGRDTSGSAAGTGNLAINSVSVVGDLLIAGKAGSATACTQSSSTASGCELIIFDIASTTNPNFLTSRDVSGSAAGTGNLAITFVTGTGTTAYVSKAANATACSQTAGSALGCEIMAFDITSSTSPTYVRGVDMPGSFTGQQSSQVTHLTLAGKYLYASNAANATVCQEDIGLSIGCELTVFDVSSSSALRLVRSRDVNGTGNGALTVAHTASLPVGNMLFVARAGSATSCSQTAGTAGAAACELAAFSLTNQPSGILMGNLSGTSALGNVIATGTVEFRDMATTSNLIVAVGTTTFPSLLTVTGDFQNNGNLVQPESILQLDSNSSQSISGSLVGANELYTLRLSGSGTKTFSNNASTTFLTIDSGATATFPNLLSVRDTYQNSGTANTSGNTLNTAGFTGGFLSGMSIGGSQTDTQSLNINGLLHVGSYVFVTKANSGTSCNPTTPGSAVGCELMVFNIESGSTPSYRAGRDTNGNTVGTGNVAMSQMALSTNSQTLYVAKTGSVTPCTQSSSSASGCELMAFDIASSTNPYFVAGRDTNGDTVGAGSVTINSLAVSGNYLYLARAANATPCTQSSSSASGCELMVFDISSTTNPVFVTSRDIDGSTGGVNNIGATSLAVSGTSLYVAKLASGATACNSAAINCELMVFDIADPANLTYQTGRDASGSAAGVGNIAINSLSIVGTTLVAVKAGSATACAQTAGSAVGCEVMLFDISSTTNPTFMSGRDISGSAVGTGNLAANFVTGTGTTAYVAKAADAAICSHNAGSATGCEVMVFDISSTTNPEYMRGIDSSFETNGELGLAVQTVLAATSSLIIGRAGSAIPCEQTWNLRHGCELALVKLPATLSGNMTGTSRLNDVTTLGLTEITTNASTSNLTIASSSVFTAPSTTLSLGGNFARAGEFRANRGTVALVGTNQTLTAPATTTFYNLTQTATTAATTTFSTTGGWQIDNNLTLRGSGVDQLALRSATDGVQWTLLPLGSTSVSYINVKDSRNSSTTFLNCLTGCTDAGNNTGWSWPAAPENVWNATDWVLYDTLTISEENITSDLTDFPVYVNLDDLSPIFWATTPTSSALAGTDIRITTNADVEVPRELVFASTTIQKGELHFKAPFLSSTTDTVFKIWYNGTTSGDYAPTATYGAQNVWTNNYLGVYHLDNDPSAGAGAITDSTSNARHGTAGGGVSSADEVTGKLGNSLDFDGGDYVEINNLFGQPAQGTLSTWFELDVVGIAGSELVSLGDSFAIRGGSGADTKGFYHYDPDWYDTAAGTQPTAPYPWKHLAFTNNPSGSSQVLYTNGVADGSTTNSSAIVYDQGTTTLFGRHGNSGGFQDLDGRMDEVRIASVVRTGDWLAAEYANQSTTTTFYGVLKTWNDSDWTSFETITIDEANIDEDLTDFPVYVNLANLSNNFWSTTPASAARVGTDIRVTTADNIEVPRELVFASSTLQTGELHFKAPLVSATTDTVFKIWYNGSIAGDYADDATYGAENVWTNNFLAVYHMQDDPTGTTTDSTSNNYDGRERSGGSFTSSDSVPGALGSAVNFSDAAIDVTNFTSHLTSFAVESWIRPTALENTANFYTIIDLKDALFLGVRDTNDSATVGTNWDSYYTWNTADNTVVDDVFQHLYVEFDDMTDTATDPVFTNNANSVTHVDNNPVGTHTQPTTNLYIGSALGFDPYAGDIDELRISSTTRSFAWRRATYLNQATTSIGLTEVNKSVGSSTLADHTAGQVSDAFSGADQTNESLFAFRVIPNSGTATVTAVTLTLSGVSSVVDTDFSNIRLLRDSDSDGQYDATDEQVGGAGVMSIVGDSGSITFTADFLSTTSLDYIVVADFTAPANGAFMTISLSPGQITVTDTNVLHIVYGSAAPVQHTRNNLGAGSASGNGGGVGGAAPAGDGDVGGGGDTGGEVIGNDPDYAWPSSQSGSWTSGASAYDQVDGTYATTNGVANHQYANHSFVVPGSNTIQGIIIRLELSGTTGAGTVDVQLSWDGGTTWTSPKSTPTLGTGDVVYTLGSPSDLWGRSWSVGDFSNANFAVRVIGNPSSNTVRLDAIQARVYHIAGGGGGGGGGAI